MSAPSTTPISVDTILRVGSSKNPTFHISRESITIHSLNSLDSELGPGLDRDNVFIGTPSTRSHTSSCPEISCFPRTYYHSSSTSSRLPTPPYFFDNPPQTPPGPHATSFLAVPSPLCLGPSICHTDIGNGLKGGDTYLDKPCGHKRNTENDELPELVTPVSFTTDDPTYTPNRHHFLSHSLPPSRISSPLSHSTSQLYNIRDTVEDHKFGFGNTRRRAMTLPATFMVSQPDSHDNDTNDNSMDFREGDLFIPSQTGKIHHTLHKKKSMVNLRDEFRKTSSTHGGT